MMQQPKKFFKKSISTEISHTRHVARVILLKVVILYFYTIMNFEHIAEQYNIYCKQ